MKRILLIAALVLVAPGGMAQGYKAYTDSLTALLDTSRKDTVQLQLLMALQNILWQTPVGDERLEQMGALAKLLKDAREEPVRKLAKRRYKTYLNNTGARHMYAGQYTAALLSYKELLHVQEEEGDSVGMALTCNNIGLLYGMAVDHALAVKYYHRALRLIDTSHTNMWPGVALHLAETYSEMGQVDSALAYVNAAVDLSRDQRTFEAYTLQAKAMVYSKAGKRSEAVALLQEALTICRRDLDSDVDGQIFIVLRGLSLIYIACDSLPQALAISAERMSLALRFDRPDQHLFGALHSGCIHARLGETTKAAQELSQAVELAVELGDWESLQRGVDTLAQVRAVQGRYAEAMRLLDLASAARDSVSTVGIRKEAMTAEFHQEQLSDSLLRAAERNDQERRNASEVTKERDRKRILGLSGLALALVATGIFLQLRSTIRSHKVIASEKARSEELLLNILPEEVATELKAKGEAEAVHIDQVTVLFTDFKGFTAMSEVVTPRQLVHDLHECFSAFDRIAEKHGIEKIKTIGDAYMAAGGLPTPNTTHATDVIKAAFEMRDFIAEGKARKVAAGLPYFEVRIGIHTGPVVAGIVGMKKFQYDIWGDTVNTASRMESSGEVGQVNISEATYALVRNETGLTFTPRGKVQAKGKGELEMYFVEGKPAVAKGYGG